MIRIEVQNTCPRSGHGVVSAAAPGMTSEQTSHGEPESLDGSVLDEGLAGILRARGCEPTRGWREGRDEFLIEYHRRHEHGNGDIGQHLQYPAHGIHSFSLSLMSRLRMFVSTSTDGCRRSSIQMKAIDTRRSGCPSRRSRSMYLFLR